MRLKRQSELRGAVYGLSRIGLDPGEAKRQQWLLG